MNGVGVALMIVVFAQTGGLTGAEVGIAGGTAVLAQRVLEAVFGDQAVRRLAKTAKEELDTRVAALMSDELLRYHRLLDEAVGSIRSWPSGYGRRSPGWSASWPRPMRRRRTTSRDGWAPRPRRPPQPAPAGTARPASRAAAA